MAKATAARELSRMYDSIKRKTKNKKATGSGPYRTDLDETIKSELSSRMRPQEVHYYMDRVNRRRIEEKDPAKVKLNKYKYNKLDTEGNLYENSNREGHWDRKDAGVSQEERNREAMHTVVWNAQDNAKRFKRKQINKNYENSVKELLYKRGNKW